MTIFKRSLFTLGAAAFVFALVLVVTSLVFMNSLYYEINTLGLKKTAKTLMAAIGHEHITEFFLEDGVNADLPVNESGDYRLTLVDTSGYVVWDSHVKEGVVNHIDRREIEAALEGKEESARRDSISTGMKRVYFALPVFDNNKVIGVFRLSSAVPEFGMRISSIIFPFVIFSLIMAVAVFWAVFAISHSLSTSIGRLVDITQAGALLLSGPEAGEPVAPEFFSLEKAIRAMTAELNFRLEQAKAEGARLEAILNGMSEAVFATDSALKLHLVNPRAMELFNIGNRNINDLSLLEATHSAELEDAAKKALAQGAALEMMLTFRTGAEQQFQVYVSPLSGVSGVVIVLQDVTRLVKLERVRKDFVANVSHELRTPIQLVKGFSETLLDAVSDSEGKSEKKQLIHFIEIIQKNADTMENLTNDLLILADLENGSSNVREPERLTIVSLIGEAISSVGSYAKRKQIEITVDCPGDLKANLYGSFIIQALINLIDNAVKYSQAKSKILVKAYSEGEELLLEVHDKGIGIPSDQQERIFERFYRVDRSRSREAGGTGLGLSIVRHIALLHRGIAEVESRTGEGSVFRLRIPIAPIVSKPLHHHS
ncbi:MAG: PAS domain-containing protein [Treponema sp.]|jgi:two-component system phosphate regulon sensor histidine kinase PhoR|nr:PAS domain-containing protein [Treponema sp.]